MPAESAIGRAANQGRAPGWRLYRRSIDSTLLFGSTIAASLCSFVSAAIYTRTIGPSGYGELSLALTLWQLFAVCATFGLIYSSSRLLLIEQHVQAVRELVGMSLLIACGIGALIGVTLACLALPIDTIFHAHIASLLIWLSPLAMSYPLSNALTLLLVSLNRIPVLAILTCAPNALALLLVLLIAKMSTLTPLIILCIQLGSRAAIVIAIASCLKPRIGAFGHWSAKIRGENRTYGWPVYIGSLAGVATSYLTGLAVFYWTDSASMGYYSLCLSLVAPLAVIPNAVASASFRSFASQAVIPGKVLKTTVIVTLAAGLVAVLFYEVGLPLFFTARFRAAGSLAAVAVIGAVLGGFGDFFNRFMGAHGRGHALRNGAFACGLAQVVGFLSLVPHFGAWGAVYATIAAQACYLLFLYVPYRRYTHELRIATPTSAVTARGAAIE